MLRSRIVWALACALATACLTASPSWASTACGWSGYSYAGLLGDDVSRGVSAHIATVRTPQVEHGHVAAWVGIGGAGLGPGGADEWLQIGLASYPGGTNELYYEVAQPGSAPRKVVLKSSSRPGSHTVAVLEVASRTDVWRVWVDGSAASKPLYLPGSHNRFSAVATTETWDGGVPSCNAFAYRFSGLRIVGRQGGGWSALDRFHWLQDPGYRVLARASSGFLAGRA